MNEKEGLTGKGSDLPSTPGGEVELRLGLLALEGPSHGRDDRAAFHHFLKSATLDNPEAHARLAAMYGHGTGTLQSSHQALYHARQAALEGHPEAEFLLGCLYLSGEGIEPDRDQAMQWIRKAAEHQWTPAEFQLGLFYARGSLVTQDWNIAAQFFEKAARKQFPAAQYALGYMYWQGLGVAADFDRAVDLTTRAAEQDNADAQCQLFELLSATVDLDILYLQRRLASLDSDPMGGDDELIDEPNGTDQIDLPASDDGGVLAPIDESETPLFWLAKAAQKNHAPAQYRVFRLLHEFGTPGQEKNAFDWLIQAAENGSAIARYELGCYFLRQRDKTGALKRASLEAGIRWFGKAWHNGYAEAEERLNRIYEECPFADFGFSDIGWLSLFADSGHAEAQYEFGYAWFLGADVPKDIARAVSLLHAAADQGHKKAQQRLAFIYEVGDGVAKDPMQAAFWSRQAQANSSKRE
jgi:TPR repeat protein